MSIVKISGSGEFLPVSKNDLTDRGWNSCEFIIVTGDAYVDHPSFGAAVIGRLLEAEGYRIGIIAQPDWKNPESFKTLGRPEYAFLISSGNLDSMVNHYSAAGRPRKTDAYSPGGRTGLRPDRALIAYTSAAKQAYKGIPVILGGIEASLRRLSHYDYWSDKLRRSVLLDSKADLLIYGMGEKQIVSIAEKLSRGEDVGQIRTVPGTVWKAGEKEAGSIIESRDGHNTVVMLPSFSEVCADRKKFAESFVIRYRNTNPFTSSALAEPTDSRLVIQNPPAGPLSTVELDRIYNLPYMRAAHPMYRKEGGVPALSEVEFSLTVNRGCFGACAFCSLAFHQGRVVQARSGSSVIDEAKRMIRMPGFKGIIHDAGGPTANFYHPSCKKQAESGPCADRECLFPEPCPNLDTGHTGYLDLLRGLRDLEGVKKVFIRSGIRFDYLMEAIKREKAAGGGNKPTGGSEFLNELCMYHVSGQLKTAPEHVSDKVLRQMKKPANSVYREFTDAFDQTNRRLGRKQYIIPYLISSHPGSGLNEAIELALYLKKEGFIPDQVQDFYPTPSSLSTCIYYTGIDPFTGKEVYCARSPEEKKMQRALLHFHKPENRKTVIMALKKAGRTDLIGRGKGCLVRE